MDAVAENTSLVDAYRRALRDWSAARAAHAPDSAEVREVFRRLEEIERQLTALRSGAIVKYKPSAGAGV